MRARRLMETDCAMMETDCANKCAPIIRRKPHFEPEQKKCGCKTGMARRQIISTKEANRSHSGAPGRNRQFVHPAVAAVGLAGGL
jgi:hypothetical protein